MKSSYFVLLLVASVSARSVENFQVEDDQSTNCDTEEIVNSEQNTDIAELDEYNTEQDPGLSKWYGSSRIAFSAYRSHDYKYLGKEQHIKFDKVLLNDGDSYDPTTGVFRAKSAGVYMFTYVIAQVHKQEARVKLVYDGKTVNGAIAEGVATIHDAQGTNTAIIHVGRDKTVWVEAVYFGGVEGNDGDYRYTSFSGFMLYARS